MPTHEAPLSEPPKPASPPRQKAPADSIDCHFHIFGPVEQYPLSPGRGYTPSPQANLETYVTMAETLGLERMVIVNPTPYGTDHRCTIDCLKKFGPARARGVAVINRTFSKEAIRDLAANGFCAARVNSVNTNTTPVSEIEWVAKNIAALGWHLELYVEGRDLPELADTILSLPVPAVVIDHMGRIPSDRGINCPEFQTLLRLLDSGKCWIKLCGYRSSVEGPPYADLLAPARKIIQTAPGRCVWGTDWPHPRRSGDLLPDDGKLLDLLYDWAPNDRDLHRILVENPSKLYRFAV
ncbi:MAG: amidohydrolase family protein [Candidatus Acidiferrales bacterium]